MTSIYIRDRSSRIVGRIQTGSQGKQFAYVGGRLVGIYNPQLDKTFDSGLRVFGNGNQLMALVRCDGAD
ncbi:TPA: hypothetical protein QDC51_005060 [Burkholderia multivorans]|uniref:hypothetical protein n=1 Tax=Burkholderia multivorans TaxID=87883 RepID=UPI001C243BFC|nr:hypothetical protein [Burkholderia multivorans]MBU9349800.1 hypothetical protein [Burkholderia multivorans]MBU9394810.1 hypothetical protein [Burkholderia multivorans]HDR9838209.1 hypothetical protein [Burkholderia multivorans]HDR9844149.1 hypothetical protein [Burkholderia multivorans]HDR9850804.1 hypothetical protein [Burkholderia multivorans]